MKRLYSGKQISKSWLGKNKFKVDSSLSDKEETCYCLRFPVYQWGIITTIEAEIKIFLPSEEIKFDVYDGQTRDAYAPYYYQRCGNYDAIMRKINTQIEGRLIKLGLEWEDYEPQCN